MPLNEVLAMGGYGTYVWTAYGITFLIFGINIVAYLREKKRVQQTLTQFLNEAL